MPARYVASTENFKQTKADLLLNCVEILKKDGGDENLTVENVMEHEGFYDVLDRIETKNTTLQMIIEHFNKNKPKK